MIVDVIVVVVIIAIIYSFVAPALNRRREDSVAIGQPPAGSRGDIESAEAYRNHLAMARWIDLQLKDDLVRSSVPEDEQARAKRLLDEFYGEDR